MRLFWEWTYSAQALGMVPYFICASCVLVVMSCVIIIYNLSIICRMTKRREKKDDH
jgi:hypothetical protein